MIGKLMDDDEDVFVLEIGKMEEVPAAGHGYVVICASTFIDALLIRKEVIAAWTFIL